MQFRPVEGEMLTFLGVTRKRADSLRVGGCLSNRVQDFHVTNVVNVQGFLQANHDALKQKTKKRRFASGIPYNRKNLKQLCFFCHTR